MINFKEDKDLMPLNHSCAHVMAQAVKHLYPEAKFWVGPVVEEGFYYDMDLGDKVITEEDIEKISKENTLKGLFVKEILEEMNQKNYDEGIIEKALEIGMEILE